MSDYTPPTLVIPTPGGNPGDGSLNGTLTVLSDEASPTNPAIRLGSSKWLVIDNYSGSNYLRFNFNRDFSNIQMVGAIYFNNTIIAYNNITTVGLGVAPLFGKDVRTGLTAADASATTLYTTTAAGQLYRLMGRILATAGTSPSATYTIKWTEGGATITKTLTISALDSDSDLSILIQPDNGTAITAQLTAISGTGTTVNVAATVEQMA